MTVEIVRERDLGAMGATQFTAPLLDRGNLFYAAGEWIQKNPQLTPLAVSLDVDPDGSPIVMTLMLVWEG